jgi:hypothetical protein
MVKTVITGVAAAVLVGAVVVVVAAATSDSPQRHAGPAGGRAPFVRSLSGDEAVVWAVGDGADGSDEGRAVAGRIARGPVDRLLYLGDVYDDGTAEEFREHYAPAYGRLARITAPVTGNHEADNETSGYDPYWRRVHGATPPDWYAFRAGGWTLLALDSEAPHDEGSPQHRWLRGQVREPGTCRIAFWHRPRYSASTEHGDADDMAPLWDALRGRASIVLSGHDHDMQRLRPVDGLTQFVSGAGGRHLYELDHDDERLAFGDDEAFGALRLTLRPGVARHAFVSADGRTLDAGTIRCRP